MSRTAPILQKTINKKTVDESRIEQLEEKVGLLTARVDYLTARVETLERPMFVSLPILTATGPPPLARIEEM